MYDTSTSAQSLFMFADVAKTLLTMVALCSLRFYAAMLILPATADNVLQGAVRAGVAVTLGAFIAYGQPWATAGSPPSGMLIGLLLKEALLGTVLGFAVSTVFWVAEGVGVMIDNQAGYNSVQQTNPLSGQQSTPVGNLLGQVAICGFYLLGGFMAFAGLLMDSFRWWPVLSLGPDGTALLELFIQTQVTSYAQAVVKLAFPLVVALVLIDLGIGLLAKTAEKLEPNNLSQPIKGGVALLVLVTFVALFFDQLQPQLALRDLSRELEVWVGRATAR